MSEPPVRIAQVGAWPGDDFDAAARTALAKTPNPSHFPQLPERGPQATLLGRSGALLTDLTLDLQPAGWRLTSGSGVDHRRAIALLRADLDRFEEAAQGFSGPVTIAIAGPWTMAAGIELPRGDKALRDHGACRDLAQALRQGASDLLAQLRARMPAIQWWMQLAEPKLSAVIAGGVPTASGYRRHRAVAEPAAAAVVSDFVTGLAAPVVLRCGDGGFVWAAAREAAAVSLDVDHLRSHDGDRLGEWLESGRQLMFGVLDTGAAGVLPTVGQIVDRVRAVLAPFQLGSLAADNLVLTPAGGFTGWRVVDAEAALALLNAARDAVASELLA